VEFTGSQAHLVGQAELGIYYTLENLTISRLANAVAAMGLARKAALESGLRAQTRRAFSKPLIDHPLLRWDLTDQAVRIAGGLALAMHAAAAFDKVWLETPPYSAGYHYARFLSHLAKNRTASHAAEVTRLAMEIFGGMGFLEETPVSRLHRESLVTAIWEGSSNIQALDMLEAIHKKGAHEPFLDDFLPILGAVNTTEAHKAREAREITLGNLASLDAAAAQWHAKDALERLADAAVVALLYRLAEDSDERYARLAQLYARRFLGGEPYPAWAMEKETLWMPVLE
jgi:hypothetical protein